jgi:alkanesulfonate monooxygenase SsuD/methylene tetrahydromethanopterin reductase-like flavin-dependent oxidoreductase (luciferase family)
LLSSIGVETGSIQLVCDEAIEIIRSLLKGDLLNYKGSFFQVNRVKLELNELHGHVPLLLATSASRPLLELAGVKADGVIVGGLSDPSLFRAALTIVRGAARKVHRNLKHFEIVAWSPIRILAPGQRIPDALKASTFRFVGQTSVEGLRELRVATDETIRAIRSAYSRGDLKRALPYVSDEIVRKFAIVGEPTECIQRIIELRKVGVTQLCVPYLGDTLNEKKETLRLLASKVMKNIGGF